MKKLAAVFVVAVLAPAVVLAWLATRSLRDQELVVHSQRALLHQGATDAMADDFNVFLDDVRVFYGRLLEQLIAEVGPDELAENYDTILRSRWSQAGVGAAVTEAGDWMSPPVTSTDPEVRRFLRDSQAFLLNAAPSEVYLAPATAGNVVTVREVPENDWMASFSRGSSRRKNAAEDSESMAVAKAAGSLAESLPLRPAEEGKSILKKEALSMAEEAEISSATTAPGPPPLAATVSEAPAAPAASAPTIPAAKQKVFLQQKVAINDDRQRTRSTQQRQAEMNEAPQTVNSPEAGDLALGFPTANDIAPQPMDPAAPNAQPQSSSQAVGQDFSYNNNGVSRTRNVTPLGQVDQLQQGGQYFRLAQAANEALADNPNRLAWSTLDVNIGQLREIMADDPEGAISRFVSGGLQILLWRRDPTAPGKIFWVQLDLEELKRDLTGIVRETAERMGRAEVSLALLDASGQVVAQTRDGFTTDWRQPFVATEVGEILPHWEVAAYLLDPRAVARSARAARLSLWALVPVLLTAIGIGGVLIIRGIGREMHLARQKTDFVSNVSHELKTPLTSIRMFSDLLSNRPDVAEQKRLEYSGIISREAARLSRLINNLLDFSRMERGEKRYLMERFDLRKFVEETVENYRHQIESDGFRLTVDCLLEENEPAEIEGDRDALSQILLNLLSNAEKYGGDAREIAVEVRRLDGQVEIAVLDRGPGVSRKNATKIFEKFYRTDDSLSSGIEGSGLGLTLARQIAHAHRGEVDFRSRPGGGSCFSLRLPLLSSS